MSVLPYADPHLRFITSLLFRSFLWAMDLHIDCHLAEVLFQQDKQCAWKSQGLFEAEGSRVIQAFILHEEAPVAPEFTFIGKFNYVH